MSAKSEVDIMAAIDKALSELEDASVRDRVLRWAWEKFSTRPIPMDSSDEESPIRSARKKGKRASIKAPGNKTKSKAKAKTKTKTSIAIVKDLNLKPSGKKGIDAFANEKQPATNQHKCVVAVYYLRNVLGISEVGANHVYTCFKQMGWRVPADLRNALQYTASVNGWLDTANMADIKVTAIGENLIEHDLPASKAGTKKR